MVPHLDVALSLLAQNVDAASIQLNDSVIPARQGLLHSDGGLLQATS